MIDFKQIWQRAAARFKGRGSPPGSQEIKPGLATSRDENHVLQAGLDNVRQLVEQSSDESASTLADLQQHVAHANDEAASKLADLQQRVAQANVEAARKLDDLQQRVELAESEHSQVQQHMQTLRTELHDTVARQEMAETRAREMETELKREHNKLLELMQLLRDRELKLEKRSGRTMWIAGAALLLGVLSSAAMVWSVRSSDRMLAELGRDLRDIKLSMTQQPARDLTPPVAEAFDAPAAVLTSPPASAPEVFLVQPETSLVEPIETDRQDLLPYDIAVNAGDAGSRSSAATSRWDVKTFFEENAGQTGVVTLPNGTQYRVLSKGNGKIPAASDTVIVDYRAFTLDGTEFDSTYSDQDLDAATFTVDEVIPGWKEALLRMEEGAQWELYIPPELAHKGSTRKRGMLGFGPLVYVIELKSVISGNESSLDE